MQLPRLTALAAVLYLTALSGCGESPFSPGSDQMLARLAVNEWVRDHPEGWVMAVTSSTAPERPEWTPSCSSPLTNGYVSLRITTTHGDLELAFRCPIDERTTAEELQLHFVRAVPWNLPHGISAPNWRFQAWLPASSIYDGVTFHTPVAGTLAVNIQTSVRGIQGESTRAACLPAADGATSADCVIRRSHAIPMQVRFTFPGDLSALR